MIEEIVTPDVVDIIEKTQRLKSVSSKKFLKQREQEFLDKIQINSIVTFSDRNYEKFSTGWKSSKKLDKK
jgi:hypothetical protein